MRQHERAHPPSVCWLWCAPPLSVARRCYLHGYLLPVPAHFLLILYVNINSSFF